MEPKVDPEVFCDSDVLSCPAKSSLVQRVHHYGVESVVRYVSNTGTVDRYWNPDHLAYPRISVQSARRLFDSIETELLHFSQAQKSGGLGPPAVRIDAELWPLAYGLPYDTDHFDVIFGRLDADLEF